MPCEDETDDEHSMMTHIRRPRDEQPLTRGVGPDPDERDSTYVYTRTEDRSIWFRLAYYQQKYSVLMLPLVFFLVIGARQWVHDAMKDTTAQLQTQIDSARRDILRQASQRDSLNRKLDILLRVTCVSSRASKSDLALAGLNCNDFSSIRP